MKFPLNFLLFQLYLKNNPIQFLSTKTFALTPYLDVLDVSECNLKTLWLESSHHPRVGDFLKNLKVFNASSNFIKNVYESDLAVSLNCSCLYVLMYSIMVGVNLDDDIVESVRLAEQSLAV